MRCQTILLLGLVVQWVHSIRPLIKGTRSVDDQVGHFRLLSRTDKRMGQMRMMKRRRASPYSSKNLKSTKGGSKGFKGSEGSKKNHSQQGEFDQQGDDVEMVPNGNYALADIVQTNHNLTILSMAMQRAGILDLLYTEGPLTLLAPSNEAFELLGEAYPDLYNVLFTHPFRLHLLDLLHSHIVEGRVIWLSDMTDGMVIYAKTNEDISVTRTINPQQQQEEVVCLKPSLQDEACVILGDVEATNGVAHVLDGVITPAWVLYSIRDAVVAVFPRLASLVECANLSNLLATKIGLTLMAPSEDATALLDRDSLCSNPSFLRDILMYHMIDEVLTSIHIPQGESSYVTLQGSILTLNYQNPNMLNERLYVNNATAIGLDIGTNTGIIHLIDQVLQIPSSDKR